MPTYPPHPLVAAKLGVPGNPASLTALPDQAAGLLCPECYDQAPEGPLEGLSQRERDTKDEKGLLLWRKNS